MILLSNELRKKGIPAINEAINPLKSLEYKLFSSAQAPKLVMIKKRMEAKSIDMPTFLMVTFEMILLLTRTISAMAIKLYII